MAEISIESREELIYLLSEAAEVEHGVACSYLFAAFSMKSDVSEGVNEEQLAAIERWRRVVLQVAGQEMAHLTLVGSSFGPATAAAIESASVAEAGAAAGTNSMARYFGSIVGAGALAGLLNTEAGAIPEISSFHIVMLLIFAMAAAGVVAGTMVHRFPAEMDAERSLQDPGTTL